VATRRPASRSGRVSRDRAGRARWSQASLQVVRQLAAAARAGEAGEKGAGNGAGVEAARLGVAERVLGQGGRGGSAEQRVGVGEGGVQAKQDGEVSCVRHRLAGEHGLLDRGGGGCDRRVGHPCLALVVEPFDIEPVEPLAEEVGVVLRHT
jgi:hypothetical protein